jgi:large subunit ribosomal protein L29
MTSAHDLRELNDDDLRNRERDLDDQVFRLRIQKSMGQLDAPQKIRELRRDLARVKTVLRERRQPPAPGAAAGPKRADTVAGAAGTAARPSDAKS